MDPQVVQYVQQLDAACEALYTATSPDQRSQADRWLRGFFHNDAADALQREAAASGTESQSFSHTFAADPSQLGKLLAMLMQSSSSFSHLFAAGSLVMMVDTHWPALHTDVRFDLRTSLLEWLATQGLGCPPYVRTAVITAVSRITKLAYRVDPRHHVTVEQCGQFLAPGAGTGYVLLGLELLDRLVDDMQRPHTFLPERPLVRLLMFRDLALRPLYSHLTGLLMDLHEDLTSLLAQLQRSGSWGAAAPFDASISALRSQLDSLLSVALRALQLGGTILAFDFVGLGGSSASRASLGAGAGAEAGAGVSGGDDDDESGLDDTENDTLALSLPASWPQWRKPSSTVCFVLWVRAAMTLLGMTDQNPAAQGGLDVSYARPRIIELGTAALRCTAALAGARCTLWRDSHLRRRAGLYLRTSLALMSFLCARERYYVATQPPKGGVGGGYDDDDERSAAYLLPSWHHETCRLLYRLKVGLTFSHLTSAPDFNPWLAVLGHFTHAALGARFNGGHFLLQSALPRGVPRPSHSVHYLLHSWLAVLGPGVVHGLGLIGARDGGGDGGTGGGGSGHKHEVIAALGWSLLRNGVRHLVTAVTERYAGRRHGSSSGSTQQQQQQQSSWPPRAGGPGATADDSDDEDGSAAGDEDDGGEDDPQGSSDGAAGGDAGGTGLSPADEAIVSLAAQLGYFAAPHAVKLFAGRVAALLAQAQTLAAQVATGPPAASGPASARLRRSLSRLAWLVRVSCLLTSQLLQDSFASNGDEDEEAEAAVVRWFGCMPCILEMPVTYSAIGRSHTLTASGEEASRPSRCTVHDLDMRPQPLAFVVDNLLKKAGEAGAAALGAGAATGEAIRQGLATLSPRARLAYVCAGIGVLADSTVSSAGAGAESGAATGAANPFAAGSRPRSASDTRVGSGVGVGGLASDSAGMDPTAPSISDSAPRPSRAGRMSLRDVIGPPLGSLRGLDGGRANTKTSGGGGGDAGDRKARIAALLRGGTGSGGGGGDTPGGDAEMGGGAVSTTNPLAQLQLQRQRGLSAGMGSLGADLFGMGMGAGGGAGAASGALGGLAGLKASLGIKPSKRGSPSRHRRVRYGAVSSTALGLRVDRRGLLHARGGTGGDPSEVGSDDDDDDDDDDDGMGGILGRSLSDSSGDDDSTSDSATTDSEGDDSDEEDAGAGGGWGAYGALEEDSDDDDGVGVLGATSGAASSGMGPGQSMLARLGHSGWGATATSAAVGAVGAAVGGDGIVDEDDLFADMPPLEPDPGQGITSGSGGGSSWLDLSPPGAPPNSMAGPPSAQRNGSGGGGGFFSPLSAISGGSGALGSQGGSVSGAGNGTGAFGSPAPGDVRGLKAPAAAPAGTSVLHSRLTSGMCGLGARVLSELEAETRRRMSLAGLQQGGAGGASGSQQQQQQASRLVHQLSGPRWSDPIEAGAASGSDNDASSSMGDSGSPFISLAALVRHIAHQPGTSQSLRAAQPAQSLDDAMIADGSSGPEEPLLLPHTVSDLIELLPPVEATLGPLVQGLFRLVLTLRGWTRTAAAAAAAAGGGGGGSAAPFGAGALLPSALDSVSGAGSGPGTGSRSAATSGAGLLSDIDDVGAALAAGLSFGDGAGGGSRMRGFMHMQPATSAGSSRWGGFGAPAQTHHAASSSSAPPHGTLTPLPPASPSACVVLCQWSRPRVKLEASVLSFLRDFHGWYARDRAEADTWLEARDALVQEVVAAGPVMMASQHSSSVLAALEAVGVTREALAAAAASPAAGEDGRPSGGAAAPFAGFAPSQLNLLPSASAGGIGSGDGGSATMATWSSTSAAAGAGSGGAGGLSFAPPSSAVSAASDMGLGSFISGSLTVGVPRPGSALVTTGGSGGTGFSGSSAVPGSSSITPGQVTSIRNALLAQSRRNLLLQLLLGLRCAHPRDLLDVGVARLLDDLRGVPQPTSSGGTKAAVVAGADGAPPPRGLVSTALATLHHMAVGVSVIISGATSSAPRYVMGPDGGLMLMTAGYSAFGQPDVVALGDDLLRTISVRALLRSPTQLPTALPALSLPGNLRFRSLLYGTLTRLLFMHAKAVTAPDKSLAAAADRAAAAAKARATAPEIGTFHGRAAAGDDEAGLGGDDEGDEDGGGSSGDGSGGSWLFSGQGGPSGWFATFAGGLAVTAEALHAALGVPPTAGTAQAVAQLRLHTPDASPAWANVRHAAIGWMRDVRGVLSATSSGAEFMMVHAWLSTPQVRGTALLQGIAKAFCGSPGRVDGAVAIPLLRLLGEYAHNRQHRIVFPPGHAGGVVVYRETSRVLATVGPALLLSGRGGPSTAPTASGAVGPLPEAMRLKALALVLSAGARLMSGRYANPSVLALYGDSAGVELWHTCVQALNALPPALLRTHAKTAAAAFTAADAVVNMPVPPPGAGEGGFGSGGRERALGAPAVQTPLPSPTGDSEGSSPRGLGGRGSSLAVVLVPGVDPVTGVTTMLAVPASSVGLGQERAVASGHWGEHPPGTAAAIRGSGRSSLPAPTAVASLLHLPAPTVLAFLSRVTAGIVDGASSAAQSSTPASHPAYGLAIRCCGVLDAFLTLELDVRITAAMASLVVARQQQASGGASGRLVSHAPDEPLNMAGGSREVLSTAITALNELPPARQAAYGSPDRFVRSPAGIRLRVGEATELATRYNDVVCAPPAMADGGGTGGGMSARVGSGRGGGAVGTPAGGLLGSEFLTQLLLAATRAATAAGTNSNVITAPSMAAAVLGLGGSIARPSDSGTATPAGLLWALSRVALLSMVLRWEAFSGATGSLLGLVSLEHRAEAQEALQELAAEAGTLLGTASRDGAKDAFARHFIRAARNLAGKL